MIAFRQKQRGNILIILRFGLYEQGSSAVPGALAELLRVLARDDMRPDGGGGGIAPSRLREALCRVNPRLGERPDIDVMQALL